MFESNKSKTIPKHSYLERFHCSSEVRGVQVEVQIRGGPI